MQDLNLCEDKLVFGDSDDEEFVSNRVRKSYTIRPRPDLFNEYCDIEFMRHFRLGKETVLFILTLIGERIKSKTDRNHSVAPLQKLLLTLRFYATGTFQFAIGDFGGIHKSTTCRIIRNVTEAIAALAPVFIKLPNDLEEIQRFQYKFHEFPKIVGVIDSTHIKIQSPGGERAEIFRNRKGIFSINVQAVCDTSLKFIDIVARWPGSTHDSTIFNASRLKAKLLNDDSGNRVLIGDNGYPCSSILLTPLLETRNRAEELYNEYHIRSRNVIEKCFVVWKKRFPALCFGLRLQVEKIQATIVAAAILHNIARDRGEVNPPIDEGFKIVLQNLEEEEFRLNHDDDDKLRQFLIDTYFTG